MHSCSLVTYTKKGRRVRVPCLDAKGAEIPVGNVEWDSHPPRRERASRYVLRGRVRVCPHAGSIKNKEQILGQRDCERSIEVSIVCDDRKLERRRRRTHRSPELYSVTMTHCMTIGSTKTSLVQPLLRSDARGCSRSMRRGIRIAASVRVNAWNAVRSLEQSRRGPLYRDLEVVVLFCLAEACDVCTGSVG